MARTKQPIIDGKKFCIHCQELKPENDFYKIRQRGFEYRDSKCDSCRKRYHAKYATKWYREHREDHRKQMVKWKKENHERHSFLMWRSHIKRKYGLSPEEYNRLIGDEPRCAICESTNFNGRRPLVDHCHTTGKVRGLLCVNCNHAIERIENVPDWCEKAKAYLANALSPANKDRPA